MADPTELHPARRSEAGLAAAILVPVAASILLIQAAETWSLAGSGPHLTGVIVWLLALVGLAAITVILGRKMNITVVGAFGVTVLCLSLGAVLGAFKVSEVAAAPVGVTLSFVVMAAAAGFRASQRSQKIVVITFWLLGAGLLAGSTWACVFGD
jgi:hypothetical protein